MAGINITDREMIKFLTEFDTLQHKFFCRKKAIVPDILKEFYDESAKEYWNVDVASEVYQTIDMVYHYTGEKERTADYCNILQAVIEKFMGQYVNIDGVQDLFRESYFHFEWMMHLEYKEDSHSYSYYRDHYIHQIRNLYEMFVFLEDLGLWQHCMESYQKMNNVVARRMRRAVELQMQEPSIAGSAVLKKCIRPFDDEGKSRFLYHYLIFATAILSALVHDIGYPIVYMNRTVTKLQKFLPLSYLFIEGQDAMPKIAALLKDSLLFELVAADEIKSRMAEGDHGTYSAIILLFQYYDNGKIYDLSPIKRMVIELTAVIIYNHTLRYETLGAKKPHRVRNVYSENPLSFLFRLCDDLQEWERVYFEISDVSNFFVCDICKTPMVKGLREGREKHYTCFCGREGINTNLFSYRRLLNVAPFKELHIEWIDSKPDRCLKLELICDRGALLQVAKYNPEFAAKRAEGIHEIREMLSKQYDFPLVYLESFVSSNPIAIKTEILKDFLQREMHEDWTALLKRTGDYNPYAIYVEDLKHYRGFKDWVKKIRDVLKEWVISESVLNCFFEILGPEQAEGWGMCPRGILWDSIWFYTALALLGEWLYKARNLKWTKEKQEEMPDYYDWWGQAVAEVWHIMDRATVILISDYLRYAFGRGTVEDFLNRDYVDLYKCNLRTRKDLPDIVEAYMQKDAYRALCEGQNRELDSGEYVYDYYSDYFLFYEMERIMHMKDTDHRA